MKTIDNFRNFPCVNQSKRYTCIPASVANVINYHYRGRQITERMIVRWYLNKNFPGGTERLNEEEIFKPISFGKIKEVLLERYDKDFMYCIKKKDEDFANFRNFLKFVEKKIDKDLPLIVMLKFSQPLYLHAVTFLGIGGNDILIYDTAPNKPNNPTWEPISDIKQHIHPNFTTLLAIPKNKSGGMND